MTTADTLQDLDALARRRPISWLDFRITLSTAWARARRIGADPADWRLSGRTPATWTLAGAFAVASIGVGLAWPGPDLVGHPGGRTEPERSVALPGIWYPRENSEPALAPPAGTPVAAETPIPSAAPAAQPTRRTLPLGKGMWLHIFDRANGGDANSIVAQAKQHGITHLYVRTGSSRMGFYAAPDLNRILPAAHAAGLKVVGWDFPYLDDLYADAIRAHQAITYTTPDGHQIDAFSADIETPSEGTNLTTDTARAYGIRLRELAGPDYPLIATVPRPNPKRWFPYPEVVHHFDAIAPMVYWINRDPVTDLSGAIDALRPYGKPILPVGQAYDPGIDGERRWGAPSKDQITAFMKTAAELGVPSVSFWAWNTATPEHWSAISEWKSFDLDALEKSLTPDMIRTLQRVLNGLRYSTPIDGVLGPDTMNAIRAFQAANRIDATGFPDARTLATLTKPYVK